MTVRTTYIFAQFSAVDHTAASGVRDCASRNLLPLPRRVLHLDTLMGYLNRHVDRIIQEMRITSIPVQRSRLTNGSEEETRAQTKRHHQERFCEI
jgi:hypothetical protein